MHVLFVIEEHDDVLVVWAAMNLIVLRIAARDQSD
jgi:hypothetical protein